MLPCCQVNISKSLTRFCYLFLSHDFVDFQLNLSVFRLINCVWKSANSRNAKKKLEFELRDSKTCIHTYQIGSLDAILCNTTKFASLITFGVCILLLRWIMVRQHFPRCIEIDLLTYKLLTLVLIHYFGQDGLTIALLKWNYLRA